MAGDPPLDQVITRTVEGGVRGGTTATSRTSWNAGVFRAENRNDILFVSSQQSGFGYFKNFGNTRRVGVELGANSRIERVALGAGYTFLSATYQSSETVVGSSNSTNRTAAGGAPGLEGTIEIVPGDRIPLIPRHLLKVFADIRVTSALSLDVDLVAASGSFARGNENNRHEPDGLYYLGAGTSDSYNVVNLGARYQLRPRIQLLAQLSNLFDRRYHTAAQLGPTGFTDDGNFIARPLPPIAGEFPIQHATFYAPGAPATFWIGTRIKF
jgi:outer membrane receptor protein involved in Fe transport